MPFASAFASADAATNSLTGISYGGGCSCTAASFSISTLTDTLVITGGQSNVDVTISGLVMLLRNVQMDQFGVLAEAEVPFDIFVNGVSVFSTETLIPLSGPNLSALVDTTNPFAHDHTAVWRRERDRSQTPTTFTGGGE